MLETARAWDAIGEKERQSFLSRGVARFIQSQHSGVLYLSPALGPIFKPFANLFVCRLFCPQHMHHWLCRDRKLFLLSAAIQSSRGDVGGLKNVRVDPPMNGRTCQSESFPKD